MKYYLFFRESFMNRLAWGALVVAAALFAFPLVAQAETPGEQLARVARQVDTALERVNAGDAAGARSAYQKFDDGWFEIEDGVRAASRESYRNIETAMGDAKFALREDSFDTAKARAALQALRAECDKFIKGGFAAEQSSGLQPTLPGVMGNLDRAMAAIDANDAVAAAASVDTFRREWIDVEGLVKVKSPAVYTSTENNMARAYTLLTRIPADLTGARAVLQQMKADLDPIAASAGKYGVFDAAVILLREGIEALLVVGGVLAFLYKTGNAAKARWIWAGSGLGVAASIVIAFLVTILFSQATAGANREVLEGVTGLVAAVMLIYVSYWMHSKANLNAWHRYVGQMTMTALARNKMFSLALISFLAIFREGAETVLFYVGIAPSITVTDLALGLLIGTVGLAIFGAVILVFGVKIPVRPFFLTTSVLVYYLAFKFIGTGIHALQVAGLVSATHGDYLPTLDFLGMYPTWETTLVQLALLVGAATVLVVGRLRDSMERGRPTAASAAS